MVYDTIAEDAGQGSIYFADSGGRESQGLSEILDVEAFGLAYCVKSLLVGAVVFGAVALSNGCVTDASAKPSDVASATHENFKTMDPSLSYSLVEKLTDPYLNLEEDTDAIMAVFEARDHDMIVDYSPE